MKNGELSRTPGRQSWSALNPDQISRLTTALNCILFLSANQYASIELVKPLIIQRQGLLSIAANVLYKGCSFIHAHVSFMLDVTATKILDGRFQHVFTEVAVTLQ